MNGKVNLRVRQRNKGSAEQKETRYTLILVAMIGGIFTCLAAIIGWGYPFAENIADYVSTALAAQEIAPASTVGGLPTITPFVDVIETWTPSLNTPTAQPTATLLPPVTDTYTPFPDYSVEQIRAILGVPLHTTIYKAVDGFFVSCYDGSFQSGFNVSMMPDGSVYFDGQPARSLQQIINAMQFNWPANYEEFFFVNPENLSQLPQNMVIFAKGPGGDPDFRNLSVAEFQQKLINEEYPLGIDDLRMLYIR